MSFTADICDLVAASDDPLHTAAPRWQRVSLGEIAHVLNGYPFDSSYFTDESGEPLIRIRDVTSGQVGTFYRGPVPDGYWVEPGDIVIGMDGDFNLRTWSGKRGLLNQRVCKITPNPEVCDAAFLALLLPGYLRLINEHTPSITVKHLSSRTLQQIPLPFPPLAEQHRIVARVEALLARTRRARVELGRIKALAARSQDRLLAHGFSGDLTATWRSETEQTSYARQELLAVQELRQASPRLARRQSTRVIPEHILPETWTWASPDEVADDSPYAIGIGPFGSNLVRSDYAESGVRLVFVRDIRRNSFGDADAHYVSPQKAEELHPHRVVAGEVLITKMGDPPGDTALFPSGAAPAIITSDCMKLRPHPSLVLPEFLTLCIKSPVVREQIGGITLGVAHQKMSLDRFRGIALPLPPLDEQREIVALLQRAFTHLDQMTAEATRALALLDRLDAAVLARAFRGELVPQDPADEPASSLIARLPAAQQAGQPRRGRRAA